MMKKSILKTYLVLIAAILCCGCSYEELVPSNIEERNDVIKVVGRVTPFSDTGAETKSTKNAYETVIKNMALFVFDSDGNKVYFNCVNSGQPLFIIDRNNTPFSTHDQSKMSACKMYILANIPSADQTTLESVSTEQGFLETDCTIANAIRMSGIESYGGLPMWGMIDKAAVDTNNDGVLETVDIDLTSDPEGSTSSTNPLIGSVQIIPLTCMMSKLTFKITVDPVQQSTYTQSFELKSWKVENIPADVLVAQPTDGNESEHAHGPFLSSAATFTSVDNGVNPIMQGGSTPMTFCCYVPEHRVDPSNKPSSTTWSYPAGVTAGDEASQNFKPRWLGDADKPLKITLNGVYTDHRNQEKEVTYTIYPGANNYNDFFVERNHEYIHNISIKGISNSIYGNELSVSLDMRVDVQQNDFKFELERETLLDSHWEIRPIRITLDPTLHENADHIEVEIMNASSTPWIRFEAPTASQISSNPSDYCDVSSSALAYGKRRYFTTDLVTSTLSGNTSVRFDADPINVEHTIWAYIDENVTGAPTSGSNTRQATVQCRYYEKNQTSPTVTENYYFIQKSLHNITQNGHTYGIEYYEEYLYNFDSRDDFTALPDGMEWGLNGEQLSYEINAIAVDGVLSDEAATNRVRSVFPNAYYDYYNTSEEAALGRLYYFPYEGRRFTRKIAKKMAFTPLATNDSPASAIEYCLNKNKRNSDGSVSDVTNWYLPAIDEIEDICMGGYSDFEVFQDKYYWSSQPAYNVDSLSYTFNYLIGSTTNYGNFYEDNVNYARATKVKASSGAYQTVESGATGSETLYSFNYWSSDYGIDATGKTTNFQDGYHSRTGNINRIRCVYKQSKSYKSMHGFETADNEDIWTSSFSRSTIKNNTENGNASGSLRVSSGWTSSTGTAVVTTFPYYVAPRQLEFYVMYSGDSPTSSTWTVSVSSDNVTWGEPVLTYTTLSTDFSKISVDLSSYGYKYVRIQNSTTVGAAITGKTTNVFIDDISLNYTIQTNPSATIHRVYKAD